MDSGSRGCESITALGLADPPAGVEGYRQFMDFDVVRIDETRCSLDLLRDGKVEPVKLGDDAILGVNSHAAENLEAGAVCVGYGLAVPELNYDDLAGQDLNANGFVQGAAGAPGFDHPGISPEAEGFFLLMESAAYSYYSAWPTAVSGSPGRPH
ncbi:MAG: hypothetical protein ABSF46_32345 [Terriglobia bacterium]